ncbi:MAG: hypothetical protein ACR2RE_15255 [Geminicoccaceae bacterium]
MADETEQNTLQDLFRVINEMRAETRAGFKEAMADRESIRSEMREGFAKTDVQHGEVKGELKAIRDVVDNELASQGQVDALEGHLKDVQRTLRQHGKKLDSLERSKQAT